MEAPLGFRLVCTWMLLWSSSKQGENSRTGLEAPWHNASCLLGVGMQADWMLAWLLLLLLQFKMQKSPKDVFLFSEACGGNESQAS